MKLILVASVVIIGFSLGSPILDDVETEWIKFKEHHGKQYRSAVEEAERKAIFSANYKMIVQHNELYKQGIKTYFLGLNERADLTIEEMNLLNGYKSNKEAVNPIEEVIFKKKDGAVVPDTFDWREKGAVSAVKDQGHCGSCWAFSTTGSIEGQYFFKTGKLVSLSEQNLVDCSRNDDNAGCKGGDMIPAFKYVHSNDGIDGESAYPYSGKQHDCKYLANENVTSIKGYGIIKEGNEDDLKAALATVGPISIAIDASKLDFNFYIGGIYYNAKCKTKNDDLDHAVLVVGYGSENGHDYWLVKNSWGTSWGLKGYIKMSRNRDNNCGIATAGCYPIMY